MLYCLDTLHPQPPPCVCTGPHAMVLIWRSVLSVCLMGPGVWLPGIFTGWVFCLTRSRADFYSLLLKSRLSVVFLSRSVCLVTLSQAFDHGLLYKDLCVFLLLGICWASWFYQMVPSLASSVRFLSFPLLAPAGYRGSLLRFRQLLLWVQTGCAVRFEVLAVGSSNLLLSLSSTYSTPEFS